MQNNSHFPMVSPAPGFTSRVMTRLAERERARARRRAWMGALALVSVASALLWLVVAQLVMIGWKGLTHPQTILALLDAWRVLVFWGTTLLEVGGVVASTSATMFNPMWLLASAAISCALALVWARVMVRAFSFSSIHVGG